MTEEQKYLFDLRGWMVLPAVLAETECAAIRGHLKAGGTPFTGPAQPLLDHPSVVDVLSDLLGGGASRDDCYPFRCEGSFVTIRQNGWKPSGTETPHGGPAESPQHYRTNGKTLYSGLTRVVWELNPVGHGDGGTLFLPGSHKASFPQPESVHQPDNSYMQDYACPAGSVVIFTESLLHAATSWKNPNIERVGIFSAYNHISAQYHRLNLSDETILSMPTKRQSLFRGVFVHDFSIRPHEEGGNRFYGENNRAL